MVKKKTKWRKKKRVQGGKKETRMLKLTRELVNAGVDVGQKGGQKRKEREK